MEVIKYLRRRKDLLTAQYELLSSENNRNVTNLSIANKEIELAYKRIGELTSEVESNSLYISEFLKQKNETEEFKNLRSRNDILIGEKKITEDIISNNKKEIEKLQANLHEKELLYHQTLALVEALKNTNQNIVSENAHWRNRVSNLIGEKEDLEYIKLRDKMSQCELLECELETVKSAFSTLSSERDDFIDKIENLEVQLSDLEKLRSSEIFYQLLPKIILITENKVDNALLKENGWVAYLTFYVDLSRLAYLVSIYEKLNKFTLSLQGKYQTIFILNEKVMALKRKIEFWRSSVDNNIACFAVLQEYLEESKSSLDNTVLQDIKDHLMILDDNIAKYFPGVISNTNFLGWPVNAAIPLFADVKFLEVAGN
ncbi:uncharacterized protein LOC115227363 [Octopus sinensis]|uniref:Uncharacterized protein LOC115227363 n=1 Tax=Octopus sinensis TaxID=2607531 RepID=A0A6P7TZC2_9MOLL|nr:uncharacterized protein LOC115227363 [Octopus sinensis]